MFERGEVGKFALSPCGIIFVPTVKNGLQDCILFTMFFLAVVFLGFF